MYYPSRENKGADQLHGYREAVLRLCFRICKLLVFPTRRLIQFMKPKTKVLVSNMFIAELILIFVFLQICNEIRGMLDAVQ